MSPTVGTWRPEVGVGAPMVPGMRLGWMERAGERVAITAPSRAGGAAASVTASGTWLAFGEVLLTLGTATLGEATVATEAAPHDVPEGTVALRAETDGTVFLRPSPESPAYAPSGAPVAAMATVALVEVMKTFSPVRAPVAGTVAAVLVDDGQSVVAGQAVIAIRPA